MFYVFHYLLLSMREAVGVMEVVDTLGAVGVTVMVVDTMAAVGTEAVDTMEAIGVTTVMAVVTMAWQWGLLWWPRWLL